MNEDDLLAAANVAYRVGREPSNAYGESLAGQWQQVSWKNTYQFCRLPLSPYKEPDNPKIQTKEHLRKMVVPAL